MRKPSVIKAAGATGLAIGLAVGGYGFASAASSTASPPTSGSTTARPPRAGLAAAAKAIGITVAQLQTELRGGKTIAAVATEHGVSVDTVIAAMVADAQPGLQQRITAEVNGTGGFAGPRRPGGPGGFGFARGADLGVAAAKIGISPTDLQTALRGGQTIAQVAKAHGVDPQVVINALIQDQSSKLDQAVASGKLTKAQADQMKSTLPQRVANQVNGVRPAFGRHGGGPGGANGGPPANGSAPPGGANAGPAPA